MPFSKKYACLFVDHYERARNRIYIPNGILSCRPSYQSQNHLHSSSDVLARSYICADRTFSMAALLFKRLVGVKSACLLLSDLRSCDGHGRPSLGCSRRAWRCRPGVLQHWPVRAAASLVGAAGLYPFQAIFHCFWARELRQVCRCGINDQTP